MSTLSIFFDLHSLQDKLDTFGHVYADSLEPLQYCPDSLDTELVTLCDEDSLDSVASYKDSPCDSLDSDQPSHLSSDSLEDDCEQEEENQSDHLTPRTTRASNEVSPKVSQSRRKPLLSGLLLVGSLSI